MPSIADLPPEVLLRIFESSGVGRAYYNDRERQGDLTRLALVARAWHGPATALLYARPAVANTGRASLLEEVLKRRPDYADLVIRLNWTRDDMPVDADLFLRLLELMPNLGQLEVNTELLKDAKSSSHAINKVLMQRSITSFRCYSAHDANCPPEEALRALPQLSELTLWDRPDNYSWFLKKFKRPLPYWNLQTLTLKGLGVSAEGALPWLLGRSDRLQSLTLCTQSQIREAHQTLILSRYASTLTDIELAYHENPAEERSQASTFVADILRLAVNLRHLRLGKGVTADGADFRHAKLETITLHGVTMARNVGLAIFEEHLPSMKRVAIVHDTSTRNLSIEKLRWWCAARDVSFEVERRPNIRS